MGTLAARHYLQTLKMCLNPRNTSWRVLNPRLSETGWDSNFFGGENLFLGSYMLRSGKNKSDLQGKIEIIAQKAIVVEIL